MLTLVSPLPVLSLSSLQATAPFIIGRHLMHFRALLHPFNP